MAKLLTGLGYTWPAQVIAERLGHVYQHDAGHALVAVTNDDVVGLITSYMIRTLHRPGDICRITALVIAEGARGQGIGRQLVAAIEDIARASGCVRVEVTSQARRIDAHEFYLRLGYTDWPKRFIKDL
jgi:GNAT superfamily N-acetyltransferase